MQAELRQLIEQALGGEFPDFTLETPASFEHGDYATNVALILAAQTGRPPRVVAAELVAKLQSVQHPMLHKIEVAGPGFINFHLAPEFFARALDQINKAAANWGRSATLAGKKVMVEYTDPNPFKELHLGHLMSNAVGETLSRLIEFGGAQVKRACYQGDVGLHVAKALWGKLKVKGQRSKMEDWGAAYAAGARAYEADESAKQEIVELNKKIYAQSEAALNELYEQGKRESLEAFEKIYQKLGTKFDFYFFESQTGPIGQAVVEQNLGKVFEASDGAVVYRGERAGLHTRVFLTSEGLPTYEAKELGLAVEKFKHWPHEESVVITGNEVVDYFKVVLAALNEFNPELAAKIRHLPHGMLRLPSGKMSSRTGEVLTAAGVIEELGRAVGERGENLSGAEREAIAVAALKYAILKQAPGREVIFDQARALSLEGDSGPYLQYAYVRARAVLAKKAAGQLAPGELARTAARPGGLERGLIHFPSVVARAREELAPQLVVAYLTGVAAAFNRLYAREQIIGSKQEAYYLVLTAAVAQTLQNGLWLLGIDTPKRM